MSIAPRFPTLIPVVLFALACDSSAPPAQPGLPDPTRSSLSADRASGLLANGMDEAALTVTVRDAAGKPLSGYRVSLTATGMENALTQPAAETDAQGVSTGKLASTKAEAKTVSALIEVGGSSLAIAQPVTVTFISSGVPAPALTAFSPRAQAAGGAVTLTGTALAEASAVTFGGGPSAPITSNTDTTITATVPEGSASGSISVTTPGGTASMPGFTLRPLAPTITSFAPARAAAGGEITIIGTNLANATAVTFGGVESADFSTDSATSIVAVVPAAASSGDVTVTRAGPPPPPASASSPRPPS